MGATLKEAQQAAAHQAIEALVSACKVVLFKVLRYSNKRLFIISIKIERRLFFRMWPPAEWPTERKRLIFSSPSQRTMREFD